jgi:hypothetical protein
MHRFRACCTIHWPPGWAVAPRIRIRSGGVLDRVFQDFAVVQTGDLPLGVRTEAGRQVRAGFGAYLAGE